MSLLKAFQMIPTPSEGRESLIYRSFRVPLVNREGAPVLSTMGYRVMHLFLWVLSPSWYEKTAWNTLLAQSLLISVTLDESVSPSGPLTKRGDERILRFFMAPTGCDFEGKLYKTLSGNVHYHPKWSIMKNNFSYVLLA